MKLPNSDKAVIPEQEISDYLLSTSHPIGRFKAKIFNELGYSQENCSLLATDLRSFLEKDAFEKEHTNFGTKYEIRGNIKGPSGKSCMLITAWIVRTDEDFPRFITAYPGDNQ